MSIVQIFLSALILIDYYFQIKIGDREFTNGGVPWTFNTKDGNGEELVPTAAFPSPTNPPAGGLSPTPISSIEINDGTAPAIDCNSADCESIKANLGKGCITADYMACLRKVTPTK